ncbi:MAG: hypothetical protein NTV01_04655, partial [Bacteroidia bacterium]|nr:hypothetical protein [Bacteroidia bacterium]
MKKLLSLSVLAICLIDTGFGQGTKKPIDFTLYDSWKSLSSQQMSDDGNWVAWIVNPQIGDGQLFIRGWEDTADKKVFNRATQPNFSPNSDFLAFKIVPQADTVRKAKINKVKTEKMPKDSLGIYLLTGDKLITYPNIKSFKLAEESSSWIVFQPEDMKADAKPEKKDSTSEGKKEDK